MTTSTNGRLFGEACTSLQDCFERVKVLFEDDDTSNAGSNLVYIDELLSMVRFTNHHADDHADDSALVKNVAQFVRDVSVFHPNACHLLLIHLPHVSDPTPFVEVMPSMFCVAPASLVQEAALQLHLLAKSDSRLLLPVIAALSEFPLAVAQQVTMLQMAEDAVDIVDESDLPVLCRILLKSMCPLKSERIILKIRREMSQVSDASSALLIEALWEVLPSSPAASELLLDQITREQEMYKFRHPSLADLSIVLILTSNANIGILKIRARRLLQTWLHQGVFPFHQLELILSLRRSNEVWSRMVPAVWRLCLWTLEALSDLDVVPSNSVASSNNNNHKKYRSGHRSGQSVDNGTDHRMHSSSNHGLRHATRATATSTNNSSSSSSSSGPWQGTAMSGGKISGNNHDSSSMHNLVVSRDGCARNREGLALTVQRLCESVPSMRETVVSNLLGMCYAVSPTDGHGSGQARNGSGVEECGDGSGAWLFSSMPPLGAAAMEYGIIPVGLASSTADRNQKSSRHHQPAPLQTSGVSMGMSSSGGGGGSALTLWRLERNFRSQRHRAAVVRAKVRAQAQLAAAILEGLSVAAYPEVGASVLASLTHRLHACGEGGKVSLPPPATLHSLMKCIVAGTASSPQMENTVFIIIQKLLAAAQLSSASSASSELPGGLPLGVSDDSSLLSTLGFDMTATSSSGRYVGVSGDIGGLAVGALSGASPATFSSSSLMQYSPGTVGCLLAGHMMLRGARTSSSSSSNSSSSSGNALLTDRPASSSHATAVSVPSLSAVDCKAVLTWLARAICPEGAVRGSGRTLKPALSDFSLVYAVDAFVACLEHSQTQIGLDGAGDAGRMLTEPSSSSSSSNSSSSSSSSSHPVVQSSSSNSSSGRFHGSVTATNESTPAATKDLVVAALRCYEVVSGGASALVAVVNSSDTDENGDLILPPHSTDEGRKRFLARLDSCRGPTGRQGSVSRTSSSSSSSSSSRTIVWRIACVCDNITANIVVDVDKTSSAAIAQSTNGRRTTASSATRASSSGRQGEGSSAATGAAMTRQRLVALAALSVVEVRAATTATAYAMLWAVQRLASLHKHLCALSDNVVVVAASARIELSASELNAPEKRPWVVGGAAAAAAIDQIPAVAAAGASSSAKRRRRDVAAPEPTPTMEGVSPDLHVWACGAADGVEGLSFTRSASLSAAEALHLAWERYATSSRTAPHK